MLNQVKEDQEYVDSILEDVRWPVSGSTDGKDPWTGEVWRNINPRPFEPNKLRYNTCPKTQNQVRHASDYFDTFYEAAVYLIKKGLAYVEELSAEEMREYRGTLTEPGRNSPHRDRPIEESLDLFQVGLKGL